MRIVVVVICIILLGHRVIERRTGCLYKPMWRDPI